MQTQQRKADLSGMTTRKAKAKAKDKSEKQMVRLNTP
jgi:hypothetical protein